MGTVANNLAAFKSVEELEAMMLSALTEYGGGKAVVGWSVGNSSANKLAWTNLPPATRITEIGIALSIKDPTNYPPDTHLPIRRSRPIFRDSASTSY